MYQRFIIEFFKGLDLKLKSINIGSLNEITVGDEISINYKKYTVEKIEKLHEVYQEEIITKIKVFVK